jgi:hypothetical protein
MNLIGEWIALSQEQFLGRGQIADEQFSIVERENSIHLSQRELMRHRLRIFPSGKVENWRGGTLWRSGQLLWDGQEGSLSPDGKQEEWFTEDDGNWEMDEWILDSGKLERIRFEVSIGSFFQQETTRYERAKTLQVGREESSTVLRAIGDCDISGAQLKKLDLSQWTIEPFEVSVLLERPELKGLKTLNLADVRCSSDNGLIDVIQSGWHAEGIVNWDLSGLCFVERFLQRPPCKQIENLSLARSDLKNFSLIKKMTEIQRLNISECQLDNIDMNSFPFLLELHARGLGQIELSEKQASQIEVLDCDTVRHQNYPKLHTLTLHSSIELLDCVPSLSRICLHNTTVEDVVWEAILQLPLTMLHCHGVSLSPSQQEALLSSGLINTLESLSITDQDLDAAFLDALTNRVCLPNLRSLTLSHSNCSLRQLCQASTLTKLQQLSLDGCPDWFSSFQANGLLSLHRISLRETGMNVSHWLEKQAFPFLEIADIGGHEPINAPVSNLTNLKQIRMDECSFELEQSIQGLFQSLGDNRNRIFHHLPFQ